MQRQNKTIAKISSYTDVNEIIAFFTDQIISIFKENLTGIYLTGSLSYQAFNYNTSDIDLTVIIERPISKNELQKVRNLHTKMENEYSEWAKRLESTYTPKEMLPNTNPPQKPRPWYWGGDATLYPEAPYGHEWITNTYLLYHHAIALVGPEFNTLRDPVDIRDVQKACVRDLFAEWEPKKDNRDWFIDSHHQAYFILNLCRIFYTIMCRTVGSKQTASSWVKKEYHQWHNLITTAQEWTYKIELDIQEDALNFLDFVISQISATELYQQLDSERQ